MRQIIISVKPFLKIVLLFLMVFSCGEYKLLRQYGLKPATIKVKNDKAFVDGVLGKVFLTN